MNCLRPDREALASYAILSAWLFFALTVGAVAVLRRSRPAGARPYLMWGYPYTLWIFLAASVWFIADAAVGQPGPSLAAFLITAAGVPFYLVWTARSRHSRLNKPVPIDTSA